MPLWNIEKIYLEQVLRKGKIVPERFTVRPSPIIEKKLSKQALASLINEVEPNLEPGSSSKDVRLQPKNNFNKDSIEKVLQDANLTLVRAVFPGEEGSTSGQFMTYIVKDEEGNEYPVVIGKGKGSSLNVENLIIGDIQKQIDNILSKSGTEYFFVNINGVEKKVNGIESTKGTPKSDFSLTYDKKPVVFISHKDGKTATDFQQYSGMTCKSGQGICEHEEVKRFIEDVRRKFPDGMLPTQQAYRQIEDKKLKLMSIYGGDYGKEFGENNVHVLLQGRVNLKEIRDNIYELSANHIMYNGEVPPSGDDYSPTLYVRFSGNDNYFNVKNGRFMIMTLKKVQRKKAENEVLAQNVQQIKKTERDIGDFINQI